MTSSKYITGVINHPDTYPDDYYPACPDNLGFGMLACPVNTGLPNRYEAGNEYRYGFNGYEKDDEVSGEGNSVCYKYRMHSLFREFGNPRVE